MLTICFSEISLKINLKFTINLNWYETDRITYHNLKKELSLNVLSDEEMKNLWTPSVLYINTDNNNVTKVVHRFMDIETTMAVTREGDFTRSPKESVDETELFKAVFI